MAFPGQLGKFCVCKVREKHCGSLENLMIWQDEGAVGCRPVALEGDGLYMLIQVYHKVDGEKSRKQQLRCESLVILNRVLYISTG